jgi:glycosyltransferase involved in cell wall biosynthesis
MPSITLILPIYNEARLVRQAVEHCHTVLAEQFDDFEIIVVDDGSTDGSAQILQDLTAKHPHLTLLSNHVNLNVGVCVQRAMVVATKDFVVHNGIDLPLAPEDIHKLMPHMDNCDVLVLERDAYPGYTVWRFICSKINRLLIKLFFHQSIRDLNFTQMYRREILPKILPVAKSPAFTTPEMILRAIAAGLRVQRIMWPYHKSPRAKGAFGKPHDILWNLYDMARYSLFLRQKRNQTPCLSGAIGVSQDHPA